VSPYYIYVDWLHGRVASKSIAYKRRRRRSSVEEDSSKYRE